MKLAQQKAADGSPVTRLYERHSPALFAYLRQQTGSPESAEDALIEVFVAALETGKLDELSEKEQVSWLWRVARNKGIDTYRRSPAVSRSAAVMGSTRLPGLQMARR